MHPTPSYCQSIVTHFLTGTPLPASSRTPLASLIWTRCRAELTDTHDLPPDALLIPHERWLDIVTLWESTGRVKKLWPDLSKKKKAQALSRKTLLELAEASLDPRTVAADLRLAEDECPACRDRTTAYKVFTKPNSTIQLWKHHSSHCGKGGSVVQMLDILLGREKALTYISDRVGEQMPAPEYWPQVDDRDISDEEDDGDTSAPKDSTPVKKAWLTLNDVSRAWHSCSRLIELPKFRPGSHVSGAGNVLTYPAHVRVNAVNCQGVMGKGVALAFSERYPGLLQAYEDICRGRVHGATRVRPADGFDINVMRGSIYGNPWSHHRESFAAHPIKPWDVGNPAAGDPTEADRLNSLPADVRATGALYLVASRDEAVANFASWVFDGTGPQELADRRVALIAGLQRLRGKRIACVCDPADLCHADVLSRASTQLRPGGVFRWDAPDGTIVLCAATKDAWREPSRYPWIEQCAKSIVAEVEKIQQEKGTERLRVVVPALGCSNGGLAWESVLVRLEGVFRRSSADYTILAPKSEERNSDFTHCAVSLYADLRGLHATDVRLADSASQLRKGVADSLASSPALVSPIRDREGMVRNVQLRFVAPPKGAPKTKFLNGGNPGATHDENGTPYAYGQPHLVTPESSVIYVEGGPNTATIEACLGDSVVRVGALDAGHLPEMVKFGIPKRSLVIPDWDAVKLHKNRAYSQGLEAGAKLHDALLWSDVPVLTEGAVVMSTGHRTQRCGGTHEELLRLAVQLVERLLQQRIAFTGISGMAIGWDQALAEAFTLCGVAWHAAVPHEGHGSRWLPEDQKRHEMLLGRAAQVTVVSPGDYRDGVMQARDAWMVARGTAVLALWDGENRGGTAATLRMVDRSKVAVYNAWKVWRGEQRLWDWREAVKRLGVEEREGWDLNDLLRRCGKDKVAAEIVRQLG